MHVLASYRRELTILPYPMGSFAWCFFQCAFQFLCFFDVCTPEISQRDQKQRFGKCISFQTGLFWVSMQIFRRIGHVFIVMAPHFQCHRGRIHRKSSKTSPEGKPHRSLSGFRVKVQVGHRAVPRPRCWESF